MKPRGRIRFSTRGWGSSRRIIDDDLVYSRVSPKPKLYHIRGIAGVVRPLVHNPRPVLLSRGDSLIGHIVWGNVFALCPVALPHVLEKLGEGDIFARVRPSVG